MIAKSFSRCFLFGALLVGFNVSALKADYAGKPDTTVQLNDVPPGVEIFFNTKLLTSSAENTGAAKVLLTHLAKGEAQEQDCVFVEKIGEVIVDIEYVKLKVVGGKSSTHSFLSLQRRPFIEISEDKRALMLPAIEWPVSNENADVFVVFTATWCGPCQKLKSRDEWRAFKKAQRRHYRELEHDQPGWNFWVEKFNVEMLPSVVKVERAVVPESEEEGLAKNHKVWTGPEQITKNISMIKKIEE